MGGLGTALLALGALLSLLVVALTCVSGVGLLLVRNTLQIVRSTAGRERARLSRWGPEIIDPGPLPDDLKSLVRDPMVHRELGWVALHAVFGFVLGIFGLTLPLNAAQNVTYPLWFQAVDGSDGGPGLVWWPLRDLGDALLVGLTGLLWLALTIGFLPLMARAQAASGRWLLTPSGDVDLSLRVAQLAATRAAALDAHAAELRRIERSLHDGTQNRLVAVNVLLGAARRALNRNPDSAGEILERAQDATEQALAELRTVVRGILPPVLADRGLEGALSGLAGNSGVPCHLEVDVPGRCAISVEATAYFVVAEALTNVTKHSGASKATVTVRRDRDRLLLHIEDDGHGGADEISGSGIGGIRRRVEAYDGRLVLTSPPGGPTSMQVELPCGS